MRAVVLPPAFLPTNLAVYSEHRLRKATEIVYRLGPNGQVSRDRGGIGSERKPSKYSQDAY